jgi:hypothetical protein
MTPRGPVLMVLEETGRPGRERRNMKPKLLTRRLPARHRISRFALAAFAVALTLGSVGAGTAAANGPRHDTVSEVRHATRKFHNVNAVIKAGYTKFTDVNGITCIDGPPGEGNMGIHYVDGALVGDGVIDAKHPEAVLYEHTRSGLRLTAVEYIVLASDWKGAQPPKLFGHTFMFMTAPNRFGLPDFYSLHAWVWKNNPSGRFEPWNPKVHCPSSGTM